ncbi:MAG: hypothetical protein R2712_13860 [Vicinamibacterales bacterium]
MQPTRAGFLVSRVVVAALTAVFLIGVGPVRGQTPGQGFVEPATSQAWRSPMAAEVAGTLPPRGRFTFPAPYNTTAWRITGAEDCGGADCVKPVGYSYWNNINNHAGLPTMLIVLGLDRGKGGAGPSLFEMEKATGVVRNLGALFPASSPFSWASGEGWYFSGTRPHALYVTSGPRLMRYDVVARTFEPVMDVSTAFGANRYLWQAHSSLDDRVHSATLRDSTTWASLGCVAYREDRGQWFYAPRLGDFDECQIDKSGRWLVIKENVDGRYGEDNRILDLETGTERVLLDEHGAGGHSDVGWGYMVAADNFNHAPGAIRLWRFDRDMSGGEPVTNDPDQGRLVYQLPSWGASVGHIAHGNARAGAAPDSQMVCSSSASRVLVPRVNEIVCYRLDGSLDTLVVAPNLTDLDAPGGGPSDYAKLPKGNLDPTGEYFIWTANAGTNRLDAYVVRIPGASSDPAPPSWSAVQWSSLVNAAATNGTLRKSGGCGGCADAGAVSTRQFASGDLAMRFTVADAAATLYLGLSRGNPGTSPNEIGFAIRLQNGVASVRESGVYRKDTRFERGDRFEVRAEGGAVRYLKNGEVFYTSALAPQYPLLVDASLLGAGATVADVAVRPGSDPDRRPGDSHGQGRGSMPASCRLTPATSAGAVRSRTAPPTSTTRTRMPRARPRVTASGSSYSPRGERSTSRHAAKISWWKRQSSCRCAHPASSARGRPRPASRGCRAASRRNRRPRRRSGRPARHRSRSPPRARGDRRPPARRCRWPSSHAAPQPGRGCRRSPPGRDPRRRTPRPPARHSRYPSGSTCTVVRSRSRAAARAGSGRESLRRRARRRGRRRCSRRPPAGPGRSPETGGRCRPA